MSSNDINNIGFYLHGTELSAVLTELHMENHSDQLTLTLFCGTFVNCTKTVKARKLKLCHFSEQLSKEIFVKALVLRPSGTQATRR